MRRTAVSPETEGDPADIAEQQAPVTDEPPGAGAGPEAEQLGEVDEADPADVYEQAIPVATGEDDYDR
jgi:hypothetical protein